MKKQISVALLLAWTMVFCLAAASEAIKFRYEDLGTLGGNQEFPGFDLKELGINDLGQVVGFSHTATGALQAFVKSPGQAMQALPLLEGTTRSHAAGINHAGVISGWYDDGFTHACKWEPGPPYQVSNLDYANSVWAYGLNDAGYLVGTGLGSDSHYHAQVFLPGGGKQDLGTLSGHITSGARGINQANTIVGFSEDDSHPAVPTACIWYYSGGGVWAPAESLFGVADSKAISINTSGQAVGFTNTSGPQSGFHGVLRSPGQALQYLEGPNPTHEVLPYDLNDSTWIVGYTDMFGAFLWTPAGGLQDLNHLVVNLPSGVWLQHAMAINQRGEIAGYMSRNGIFNGAFKLTPIIPLPNSTLLLD